MVTQQTMRLILNAIIVEIGYGIRPGTPSPFCRRFEFAIPDPLLLGAITKQLAFHPAASGVHRSVALAQCMFVSAVRPIDFGE